VLPGNLMSNIFPGALQNICVCDFLRISDVSTVGPTGPASPRLNPKLRCRKQHWPYFQYFAYCRCGQCRHHPEPKPVTSSRWSRRSWSPKQMFVQRNGWYNWDGILTAIIANPTFHHHYAEQIATLSGLTKSFCLSSAEHFQPLAGYLNRQKSTPHSIDFPVLVTRHIPSTGSLFNTSRHLNAAAFIDSHRAPSPDLPCVQLTFARGFLTKEWITAIATQYRVHPEFFRRHMRFLQFKDYYDLPSLPSASRDIIRLVVPSIWTRQTALKPGDVQRLQKTDIDVVTNHQRRLLSNSISGESIVRRFAVLDEKSYILEQDISICIIREGAGWNGRYSIHTIHLATFADDIF